MKKGIIFLFMFAAFAASFALLINLGVRANSYTFWIVLVLLPLSGYIAAKTDFTAND
jgi:hypothetical protein